MAPTTTADVNRMIFRQTSALLRIGNRLKQRLQHVLRNTPEGELPDEHWRKTYETFGKIVMGVLAEQRARQRELGSMAQLPAPTDPLTPDEELELEEIAKAASMRRAVIDAEGEVKQ